MSNYHDMDMYHTEGSKKMWSIFNEFTIRNGKNYEF